MTRILLLALALALGLSTSALADFYIAAKTGPVLVDVSGDDVDKNPTNIGVALGYELGVVAGDLALEAEFTRSASDGELDSGADLEVASNAIYVAFTTAGPIYLKLRGGLSQTEITVGNADDSESGETYGIGVGFSLGLLRLEAEITRLHEDVNFLSVGIVF